MVHHDPHSFCVIDVPDVQGRREGGDMPPPPEIPMLKNIKGFLDNTLLQWLLAHMSSASGGFAPRPAPGLCPWTPLGKLCPQFPGFVPLRNKFLATSLQMWNMLPSHLKNINISCEQFKSGGGGQRGHVPPNNNSVKIFLGNYCIKFWHFLTNIM